MEEITCKTCIHKHDKNDKYCYACYKGYSCNYEKQPDKVQESNDNK